MADRKGNKRGGGKSGTGGQGRAGPKGKKNSPGGRARGFRRIAKWTLVAAIWIGLGLGGMVAWYAWDLPDIARLETPGRRPAITLVAADGSVLARYGDHYGGAVPFADLPPHLVQAVVATEDRRFFEHGGFDPWAIARAAVANLRAMAIREGGSTITQQLAKNLFLTPDRTLRRKAQELLTAIWLETRFTKQQIFAIYANRVYLGSGVFGMEAAARRYFGKSVRDVGLYEAAVLAGLLKAPSRYSPLRHPESAAGRAERVIKNMVAAGYLSARDAARAPRRKFRRTQSLGVRARYFADWVLDRATGFVGGGARDLKIMTTLDPRLQALGRTHMVAALKREATRRRVGQGALVALSHDGAIRAMVGGRSYTDSQFNRATQALRQPGSAFKLFVYLAGLESGYSPNDRVVDRPIKIGRWRPRNYTGKFVGETNLTDAFARSLNTVAVQVSESAGRKKVISAARRLGITTQIPSHPSLALGAAEVSLLELTGAYAAIANQGRAAWPYGISEIRDSSGAVLYRRSGTGGGQVIEPRHVAALNGMLRAVIERGTGRNAALDRPAAGKTGTSQEWRDAWFIGYTSDLATGIWVGNDDGSSMKRVTGGGLPARLWRGFMRDAHKGRAARRLPVPVRWDPGGDALPGSGVQD